MEWSWEALSAISVIVGAAGGALGFYIRSMVQSFSRDFRPAKEIDADQDHLKRNYQMADQALKRDHDTLSGEVSSLRIQVERHEVKLGHIDTSVQDLKSGVQRLDQNVQGLLTKVETTAAVTKTQHDQTMLALGDLRRDVMKKD